MTICKNVQPQNLIREMKISLAYQTGYDEKKIIPGLSGKRGNKGTHSIVCGRATASFRANLPVYHLAQQYLLHKLILCT